MSLSDSTSTSFRQTAFLRSLGLPVIVAAVALVGAFIAAKLIGTGDGIDGVNGFVESLSGGSGSFLGNLGLLAPLGFAFAAGMVSAVNPCGFAMLPAYLGLYLGSDQEAQPGRQLGRALIVGSLVTAGLIVLFGAAGVIMQLGLRTVAVTVLPWLGLGIGIVLALAGSWMIGGGKLYTGFAAQAASRMGDPNQVSPKGYFLFGLSYGTASLSCTLPIFLSVVGVGTVLSVSNLATSFGQFLLYALGMGLVIMVLTLGMAFFKGAMVKGLRKALPYIGPVGSWLMVIAGAYIVFYWVTIGGLL